LAFANLQNLMACWLNMNDFMWVLQGCLIYKNNLKLIAVPALFSASKVNCGLTLLPMPPLLNLSPMQRR
jgi:hypothetical protein